MLNLELLQVFVVTLAAAFQAEVEGTSFTSSYTKFFAEVLANLVIKSFPYALSDPDSARYRVKSTVAQALSLMGVRKMNARLEFCQELRDIIDLAVQYIADNVNGNVVLRPPFPEGILPVHPVEDWVPPTLSASISRRLVVQDSKEDKEDKEVDEIQDIVVAKEVKVKEESEPAQPRRRRPNKCTWVATGIPSFEIPATRLEFGTELAKYRPYGTIPCQKTTFLRDYLARKGKPSPLRQCEIPDAAPVVSPEPEDVSDAESDLTMVEAPPKSRVRRFLDRVRTFFKKNSPKEKVTVVEVEEEEEDAWWWNVPASYGVAFEKAKAYAVQNGG